MDTNTLIELYANNLKHTQKQYYISNAYNMYPHTEQQRELIKTYYIADKKQRLQRVRHLINNTTLKNSILIAKSKEDEYKKSIIHKKTFADEYEENTMFYGCWNELSSKRMLEIECYIQEITDHANTLNEKDTNKAINYLIDQQFTYHIGIFDNEANDLKYRNEYNNFIYDLLQLKINEISKMIIEPIQETINKLIRKPLIWNADKDTIGTLFGLLYKAKIITGTKADLNRSLTAIFNNLSDTTLKKNLELSSSVKEGKTYHDTETVELVKNWIEYLKKQL